MNGSCKYCLPGYAVTLTGVCGKIPIPGCAEIQNGQCISCLDRVLIQNGICNPKFKCANNCAQCGYLNGQESCTRCLSDYALAPNKKCELETLKTANCLHLQGSTGLCAVCDVNYYFNKGTCVRNLELNLVLSAPLFSKFLLFFAILLNL